MTQDFDRRSYTYDKYSNPVLHAHTHEADGTDPIGLEFGNLTDVDVTGAENGSELVYDTTGIQPVWRVNNRTRLRYLINNPYVFTSGANDVVMFDTMDYDNDAAFDGEYFIAQQDGYHTIHVALDFDVKAWVTSEVVQMRLEVNNTVKSAAFFYPQVAGSYGAYLCLSDNLYLEAGDTVHVEVNCTFAGTLQTSATPEASYIYIHN